MPNDIVKTSSDIENVDWSTGTAHYANVVRFGSSSSQASQSSGDICRICHCESDPQNPLLTPCYCSGSLKYVHQACLQQWLTASETNACELCKFPFIMHTKIKPFNEWRSLDMSGVERRRLCCAVLFHCAAAVCVIWSLCVLIERAAEEVKRGLIGWPFWTKLAVVTVGLTGGVVFMYIQCRQYLHLCHRWRARNRILLIQNAPEKIHPLCQVSPILHSRNIPRNNSSIGCGGLPLVGVGAGMTTNGYNYNMYGYSCPGGGGDCIDGNPIQQFGPINQNIDNSTIDKHNYGHVVPLHGKIIANIENCNPAENYDRDWTLDDQIPHEKYHQDNNCESAGIHTKIIAGTSLDDKTSCNNSLHGSKQELNIASSNNNLAINNNSTNNIHRTNDLDLFKTTTNSQTTIKTQSLPTTSNSNLTTNNNCNNGDNNRTTISHPLELTDLSNNKTILKYPNSSVFVENRDILNDTDYPKINYRHSSVLTSPDITDNLDKFLGKDCRRYSDTKLLQNDTTSTSVDILNPIFNVALNSTNNDEFRFQRQHNHHHHNYHQKLKSGRNNNGCCGNNNNNNSVTSNVLTTAANSLTGGEQTLMHNILGAPQITDIIFESATQLDPLELNIQEMLDMDLNQHYSRKKMRRSLNHFDTTSSAIQMPENNDDLIDNTTENNQLNEHENKQQQQQQITQQSQHIDKSRSFFKSLPNLSSSCESLIKK